MFSGVHSWRYARGTQRFGEFFLQRWPCLSADKYDGIPGRTSLQKVPPRFTELRRILKYFFHQRRDKRINEIPNTLPID